MQCYCCCCTDNKRCVIANQPWSLQIQSTEKLCWRKRREKGRDRGRMRGEGQGEREGSERERESSLERGREGGGERDTHHHLVHIVNRQRQIDILRNNRKIASSRYFISFIYSWKKIQSVCWPSACCVTPRLLRGDDAYAQNIKYKIWYENGHTYSEYIYILHNTCCCASYAAQRINRVRQI